MRKHQGPLLFLDITTDGENVKFLCQNEEWEKKKECSKEKLELFQKQSAHYGLPRLNPNQVVDGAIALSYLECEDGSYVWCRVQIIGTKNISSGVVTVAFPDHFCWDNAVDISNLYEYPLLCNPNTLPSEVLLLADVVPSNPNGWIYQDIEALKPQLMNQCMEGTIAKEDGHLGYFRPYTAQGQLLALSLVECGLAQLRPSFDGFPCQLSNVPTPVSGYYAPSPVQQPAPGLPPMAHANSISVQHPPNIVDPAFINNQIYGAGQRQIALVSPSHELRFIHSKVDEGIREEGCITDSEKGPWKFSMKLKSKDDMLDILEQSLKLHSLQGLSPATIKQGSSVLWKIDSERCARGLIVCDKGKDDGWVGVYLVDYGNTRKVFHSCLFVVPMEIMKLPMLAIRCRLQGIPKTFNPQIANNFEQLIQNTTFDVTFGKCCVDLLKEVTLEVQNLSVAKLITQQIYNYSNLNSGDEVFITSACSESGVFYLRLRKSADVFKSLQTEIQKEGTSASIVALPFRGQPCVAIFSHDSCWYRGLILESSEDKIMVRFVDIGYKECVPRKFVKNISGTSINCLPAQASPCIIDELKDELLDAKTISDFTVVGSDIAKLDGLKVPVPKAKLSQKNGNSLIENMPQTSTTRAPDNPNLSQERLVQKPGISLSRDMLKECKVTCIESPLAFYITLLENAAILEKLTQLLREHSTKSTSISNYHVGQYVVLLQDSTSQQCFLRGQIEQCLNQTLRLRLLDVGKSIPVKKVSVRNLPEEVSVQNIPPQAVKCSLHRHEKSPTESFSKRFANTFNDQNVKVHFIEKRQDCWNVSLVETEDLLHPLIASPSKIINGNNTVPSKVEIGKRSPVYSDEVKSSYRKSPSSSESWRDSKPSRDTTKEGFPSYTGKADQSPHWRCVDDRTEDNYVETWDHSNATSRSCELKDLPIQSPLKNESVFITYVAENEGKIYLQRNSDTEKLKEIRTAVKNNVTNSDELKIAALNKLCLGQSIEDDSWYRGCLVSVSKTVASVQYIDYGNTEGLPKSRLKKISSSLAKYPKLAYCCSLKDNDDVSFLSDYIDEELKVKVQSKVQNEYAVTLEYNGEVLGKPKTNIKSISSCSQLIPPIGQKLSLVISHIGNNGAIYTQMTDNDEELDETMDKLATLSDNSEPLKQVSEGTVCSAKFSEDGEWYRAKVLSCNQNEAIVYYIDYGNSESLSFSELRKLPAECASLPGQAIHCEIFQGREKERFSNLSSLEWLDSAKITAALKQQSDELYLLKDPIMDGTCIKQKIIEELGGAVEEVSVQPQSRSSSSIRPKIIPPFPVPYEKVTSIIVPFIDDDGSIWIQCAQSTEELDEVMTSIGNYIAESTGLSMCSDPIGKFCLAKYPEDRAWYRVMITDAKSDEEYEAHFVDYGNTDSVMTKDVYEIPSEFTLLPCQAIHCTLSLLKGAPVSDEVLESLSILTSSECITAKINNNKVLSDVNVDGTPLTDVIGNIVPKSVNETIEPVVIKEEAKMKDKTGTDTLENDIFIPPHQVVTDEEVSFYMTFIEDDGHLWIQIDSNDSLEILEELMESIVQYFDSDDVATLQHPLNRYCIAKYSEDGVYYRGFVEKKNADGAFKVHFIDYGNKDYVKAEDIYELPFEFSILSSRSIRCSIDQLKENVKPEEIDALNALSEHKAVGVLVEDGDRVIIKEMRINDSPIAEAIQNFLSGTETNESSEMNVEGAVESSVIDGSKAILDPEARLGETSEFLVACVESDMSLWIQPADTAGKLEELMELINDHVASGSAQLSSCPLNNYCIAKYEEDDRYYRVYVSSAPTESSFEVSFIDYGNVGIVQKDEIFEMDNALQSLPSQAIHCRLETLLGLSDISDELLNELDNLSDITGKMKKVSSEFVLTEVVVDTLPLAEVLGITVLPIISDKDLALESKQEVVPVAEEEMIIVLNDSEACSENISAPDAKEVQIHSVEGVSEGNFPIDNSCGTPGSLNEISPLNLALNTLISFSLSYVVDDGSVWIQLDDNFDDINQLMDDIKEHMLSDTYAVEHHPVNRFCIAKYHEDDTYYRVYVQMKCSDDSYQVHFVDHGNEDNINGDLYEIPSEMRTLPKQAIHCHFSALQESFVTSDFVSIMEHLMDRQFSGYAQNKDDKIMLTNVTIGDEPLAEFLGLSLEDQSFETAPEESKDSCEGYTETHSESTSSEVIQVTDIATESRENLVIPTDVSSDEFLYTGTESVNEEKLVQMPDESDLVVDENLAQASREDMTQSAVNEDFVSEDILVDSVCSDEQILNPCDQELLNLPSGTGATVESQGTLLEDKSINETDLEEQAHEASSLDSKIPHVMPMSDELLANMHAEFIVEQGPPLFSDDFVADAESLIVLGADSLCENSTIPKFDSSSSSVYGTNDAIETQSVKEQLNESNSFTETSLKIEASVPKDIAVETSDELLANMHAEFIVERGLPLFLDDFVADAEGSNVIHGDNLQCQNSAIPQLDASSSSVYSTNDALETHSVKKQLNESNSFAESSLEIKEYVPKDIAVHADYDSHIEASISKLIDLSTGSEGCADGSKVFDMTSNIAGEFSEQEEKRSIAANDDECFEQDENVNISQEEQIDTDFLNENEKFIQIKQEADSFKDISSPEKEFSSPKMASEEVNAAEKDCTKKEHFTTTNKNEIDHIKALKHVTTEGVTVEDKAICDSPLFTEVFGEQALAKVDYDSAVALETLPSPKKIESEFDSWRQCDKICEDSLSSANTSIVVETGSDCAMIEDLNSDGDLSSKEQMSSLCAGMRGMSCSNEDESFVQTVEDQECALESTNQSATQHFDDSYQKCSSDFEYEEDSAFQVSDVDHTTLKESCRSCLPAAEDITEISQASDDIVSMSSPIGESSSSKNSPDLSFVDESIIDLARNDRLTDDVTSTDSAESRQQRTGLAPSENSPNETALASTTTDEDEPRITQVEVSPAAREPSNIDSPGESLGSKSSNDSNEFFSIDSTTFSDAEN